MSCYQITLSLSTEESPFHVANFGDQNVIHTDDMTEKVLKYSQLNGDCCSRRHV